MATTARAIAMVQDTATLFRDCGESLRRSGRLAPITAAPDAPAITLDNAIERVRSLTASMQASISDMTRQLPNISQSSEGGDDSGGDSGDGEFGSHATASTSPDAEIQQQTKATIADLATTENACTIEENRQDQYSQRSEASVTALASSKDTFELHSPATEDKARGSDSDRVSASVTPSPPQTPTPVNGDAQRSPYSGFAMPGAEQSEPALRGIEKLTNSVGVVIA